MRGIIIDHEHAIRTLIGSGRRHRHSSKFVTEADCAQFLACKVGILTSCYKSLRLCLSHVKTVKPAVGQGGCSRVQSRPSLTMKGMFSCTEHHQPSFASQPQRSDAQPAPWAPHMPRHLARTSCAFSASATEEVTQDRLVVTLQATREGNAQASDVQTALKQVMESALTEGAQSRPRAAGHRGAHGLVLGATPLHQRRAHQRLAGVGAIGAGRHRHHPHLRPPASSPSSMSSTCSTACRAACANATKRH